MRGVGQIFPFYDGERRGPQRPEETASSSGEGSSNTGLRPPALEFLRAFPFALREPNRSLKPNSSRKEERQCLLISTLGQSLGHVVISDFSGQFYFSDEKRPLPLGSPPVLSPRLQASLRVHGAPCNNFHDPLCS